MSEAVKVRLTHALLSMLLAAGLLLPLLGIMEPSFPSPTVLLWCAGIVLLFELASVNRITAFRAYTRPCRLSLPPRSSSRPFWSRWPPALPACAAHPSCRPSCSVS